MNDDFIRRTILFRLIFDIHFTDHYQVKHLVTGIRSCHKINIFIYEKLYLLIFIVKDKYGIGDAKINFYATSNSLTTTR